VYARSTEFTADTSTIDRGVTQFRDELMPALLAVQGCQGVSLLVDRATGRCIGTTSWEDEQSMRASEQRVGPIRSTFVGSFGGASPTTVEWEVALMHRDHPSTDDACARVSWLQGDVMAVDNAVDGFRGTLPQIERLPGFSSASLFINRDTGRAVVTAVYDTAAAIAQARGQANTLRSQLAEETNTDVLEVAEFELAVAHLRVPELA
jgi:heme-degrading monooxygenase HmoA